MSASYMPTEDPQEPSQTVCTGPPVQPPGDIPSPPDPVDVATLQSDQDNLLNGHSNLFVPANADPDQQVITLHASNGTFQKEEHNGKGKSDVADEFANNTQSWQVFSHTISVKTGFPDSESWSQENGHNGKVSFDTLELEEETLKLPVVKGRSFSQPATYDLTVVIPTRNERDNIMPLLHELQEALDGIRVEIIFVDDSDDDTPLIIKDASVAMGTSM